MTTDYAAISDHIALTRDLLWEIDPRQVMAAAEVLRAARDRGALVLVAGNGGSAATASHFACDLQKACGLRAVALTDAALLTAWGNDENFSATFAHMAGALALDGDVVVLISASGLSPNIMRLFYESMDRKIVAIFGERGEANAAGADAAVVLPSYDYESLEDAALVVCHAIKKALLQ